MLRFCRRLDGELASIPGPPKMDTERGLVVVGIFAT